jgi:hypothetical protein
MKGSFHSKNFRTLHYFNALVFLWQFVIFQPKAEAHITNVRQQGVPQISPDKSHAP